MTRSLVLAALLVALAAPVAADPDPQTLFEHGSIRRAALASEQRLAAHPDDAGALALLARARAREGRFDEATAFAERAVKAAPASAAAHVALAEVCGIRAQRAGVLSAAGLARRSRKESEAALALDPRHVDALEALITFHLVAPGIMGGDRAKAAEYAERLGRVDPVRGWSSRAQVALQAHDSTRAEQCWRSAVALTPPSADARLELAAWLSAPFRRPDEALRLAREAVALEPAAPGGWQLIAMLDARAGRWSDLDADLARAEEADPEHLVPCYAAARELVVARREPARAERLLRHYLSRETELGAPPAAAARWRLGLALEQEGRRAEAIAELEGALKLDPKFENARKDLKRLRG